MHAAADGAHLHGSSAWSSFGLQTAMKAATHAAVQPVLALCPIPSVTPPCNPSRRKALCRARLLLHFQPLPHATVEAISPSAVNQDVCGSHGARAAVMTATSIQPCMVCALINLSTWIAWSSKQPWPPTLPRFCSGAVPSRGGLEASGRGIRGKGIGHDASTGRTLGFCSGRPRPSDCSSWGIT